MDDYENLKKEIKKTLQAVEESFKKPNLFSILNIETKELIHSRFIAYCGKLKSGNFEKSIDCPSHNYGKKLTVALLESWGIYFDRRCNVDVCIEYEDANLEGRIDILIKVGTKLIAIENKIYAGDQELQLKRYHEFLTLKKKSRKISDFELIYLTLDGREASVLSIGEEEFEYHKLSYSNIIDSLEVCEKEIQKGDPLLTYISEYQNVIKNLVPDYVIANKIIENDNWIHINKILGDNDLKESVKESLNKFVYPYLIENVIKPQISGNDLYPENNNLYMWIKTVGKKEYDIFFTIEDGIIKYFPICIDSSGQKPKWYCSINNNGWRSWASREHWGKICDFTITKNIQEDINSMKKFIEDNKKNKYSLPTLSAKGVSPSQICVAILFFLHLPHHNRFYVITILLVCIPQNVCLWERLRNMIKKRLKFIHWDTFWF